MKILDLSQTEFSLVLSMMLFTQDRARINNDEKSEYFAIKHTVFLPYHTSCFHRRFFFSFMISVLVDDGHIQNKSPVAEEYEQLAEMLRQSIENNPKRKKQNNKHIFAKVIEVSNNYTLCLNPTRSLLLGIDVIS